MTRQYQALGALLDVDPTDPNAVESALANLNETYTRPAQQPTKVFEDFLGVGATLADNPNVTITQTGTPTTAAVVSSAVGVPVGHRGWLSGATDDVDAEIDLVSAGKKPWILVSSIPTGKRAVAEIGFVIPTALTARQYFFGFSDAELEATTTNGPLNIQSALTTVDVADDAVGFIFSSLATAPTVWKYSNTNATTQATNATTTGVTAVAASYHTLRVELDNTGKAYLYLSVGAGRGVEPNLIATVTSAVATTAVVLPVFSAAPTTTTAVPYSIDYISGICP